ncbi:MAG: hypothetical protein HN353_06660 [Bdellovibrionales bacterium]|nr:hypothetical protein [Bdellovibrionales bacterium]MBT3526432.1 hypothetical protein [Bdellovibrionales bacterium]MBT7669970.1 hypothetical protein [Bdellovibrionales bacterium]
MNNKEVILTQFRQIVDGWLNEKEVRNIVLLSTQSKVSESVIRRAYNQQTLPNAENMLRILSAVSDKKAIHKLIADHPGAIADYLNKAFYHYLNEEEKGEEPTERIDWDEHTRDFNSYLVIKKVSHRTVTFRSDILSLFGQMGLNSLDRLVEAGIIEEWGDGRLTFKPTKFSLNTECLKHHVASLIETFFKPQVALAGGNSLISNISEDVNQNGFNKCKNILFNANEQINRVIHDHPGKIPLLFTAMVDTMDFNGGSNV